MFFIDQIINQINESIYSSLKKESVFQRSVFRGFAETVYRATEKENVFEQLPCIIDDLGTELISPDSRQSMLVYYRNFTESYRGKPGTGDAIQETTNSAEVSMMVYGFRDQLGYNSRQMNAILIDALPQDFVLKNTSGERLMSGTVIPSMTNYTTKMLLEREFGTQHVAGFLLPENFFFEIKLKIESDYKKGCFTYCNCDLKT